MRGQNLGPGRVQGDRFGIGDARVVGGFSNRLQTKRRDIERTLRDLKDIRDACVDHLTPRST